MEWLIVIIVGAIIGWIASSMMGMKSGLITSVVIGVVGAALARWLFGSVLGWGGAAAGGVSLLGIIWGVVGAVVLIWALRAAKILS